MIKSIAKLICPSKAFSHMTLKSTLRIFLAVYFELWLCSQLGASVGNMQRKAGVRSAHVLVTNRFEQKTLLTLMCEMTVV